MTRRSRLASDILGSCAGLLLFFGAVSDAYGDDRSSEPDATRFHLTYAAPEGCPDRAAFLHAIRLRTRRPQLAGEGEAALTFTVSVEPRQGSVVGSLVVRDPDAGRLPPQTRTVSSRTCPEVTKALALVAALILDPDAETGAEVALVPVDEPPDPVKKEEERRAGRSDDEPDVPAMPLLESRRRPPPRERLRPRPEPHRPIELAGGAELAMTSAVGPGIAPKVDAFFDMALAPRSGTEGTVTFAPALRVAVGFGATSSDLAIGSHGYWWAGGTARLCPVRVALSAALRLTPCGAMQVGAHHGSTRGVPNGTTSTDLWLAPEAGASLDWRLSSSVTLELHGGAILPLIRTRFFLAPNTTIFAVPSVAGTGSIAARVRFW